jgi:chromate transporter
MIDPLIYFWLFLKASLFSTGGVGNLPSLHTDLIARGWAQEHQFAEALAIGQISPGPNGLWVVSLGYLTYGVRGAVLATLAVSIVPMLILVVNRIYGRSRNHPAVQGFVRGLGLAVAGSFLVAMVTLATANGLDLRSIVIILVSIGLGVTGRVPVVVQLGLAGLVGILLYR